MKKKILFALAGVVAVVCVIGGIKALQIRKLQVQGQSQVMPAAVVSAFNATASTWETVLPAVGSVASVQGVTVTAEMPGKVVHIGFTSGDRVRTGALLVQQDASQESAQLRALGANEALARVNLERMEILLGQDAVARSDYDAALALHQQLVADMDAVRSAIAKKTIRAPFSGTLGLRQVNLGQNLAAGTVVTNLQRLDQVYVEFSLPQQQSGLVRVGEDVRVTTDFLARPRTGRLLAVEPKADEDTRSVRMQALLDNTDEALRPGMFVNVGVVLPEKRAVILVPLTAILSAAYGDSVYVLEKAKDASGLILRQQFVTLGERRGDFVEVNNGVAVGQSVVSTGVFKYRNGQSVIIDNTLSPQFQIAPVPENS